MEKLGKKPDDDTVRYKITKSNDLGYETMKMTIFSRTAPKGASYYRPKAAEERGKAAGKGMTKEQCHKEMDEQTRACSAKGGSAMDVMMCKNKVMMNHLDCM